MTSSRELQKPPGTGVAVLGRIAQQYAKDK